MNGKYKPAGQVLVVMVVGLVLAAFLNVDSLVAQAERKPFGWSRDFSLAVWKPVQTVSGFFRINAPRSALDEATGRADSYKSTDFTFPEPDDTTTSTTTGGTEGGETEEPEAPDETTTTTEAIPELRTPTAGEPLRLWVGGDSMSQVFGQSLVSFVEQTGVITSTLDYRISTGLTRPDYFNWPAHLDTEMERLDPEAVVIMFGANDAQGMEADGQVFERLSDGWKDHYRRRVAGTMDLLKAPGRIVYWVGQPIMRDSAFSGRMAQLNEIYSSEAATRPWVKFIDSYSMFANESGNYEAYLTGLDGSVHDMRQGDGIHLSRPGGDLLARHVLDLIEADANIVDRTSDDT
ncbi:MAG: DUF459 domain-containing protein [Acidimicrobiia bacterium]